MVQYMAIFSNVFIYDGIRRATHMANHLKIFADFFNNSSFSCAHFPIKKPNFTFPGKFDYPANYFF